MNAKIKVWKPLDDLDLRFSFFYIEKEKIHPPHDRWLIFHWILVPSSETCCDNNPGWLYEPTRLYHYPTLQRKKCMDQPKDPAKKQKKKKTQTPPPPQKKTEKKLEGGGVYLCESFLGESACWRAFIGKRLVRRGLQQQYIMRCSNSV